MLVHVDVIIIRAFPSLYHFHLVTPAARKWVKKRASSDREIEGNVLKVERKFARNLANGMNFDRLRITADVKTVLP
jgi:hypothetical protein